MYKKIKIRLLDLDTTQKTYSYSLADDTQSKDLGILKGVLDATGGKDVGSISPDATEYRCLWIVVHTVDDFLCATDRRDSNSPTLFAQELLMDEKNRLPIIHVSTTDIFLKPMYGPNSLHKLVPRSHLIIDSSIWNYHVSIFGLESINYELKKEGDNYKDEYLRDKDFKSTFINALDNINKNYQRHLYDLQVANEYAELNSRLVREAYLTGTHAKGVSPFVFHSEDVISKMIYDEFKGEKSVINKIIEERKWRFLLVDDKAVDGMECHSSSNHLLRDDGLRWNCKLAIIKDLLENCLKTKIGYKPCMDSNEMSVSYSNDDTILIEYAQTLDEAEQAMQNKKYDIILLDYLLDETKTVKRTQNYGYSLLNSIYYDRCEDKENTFNNYKSGPSGRFFFMFISAYSTAVYERLLAESLNLSEVFWHISLGACPTNTPQLFLYNLLQLMNKRLKDSGIYNLEQENIISLLKRIYSSNDKEGSVRHRAYAMYQDVLQLQYRYRELLKDLSIPAGDKESIINSKGSVLVSHFITRRNYLGGLLEHISNLVHLTAFGTIRQWSEMWEEYIFIRTIMIADKDEESKKIELFKNMEEYILKLKNMQQ